MQGADIDVGAAGLEQCAPPFRPDAGNESFELRPLDDARFDALRKLRQLIASQMEIAASAEEPVLGKCFGRIREKIARCAVELGDFGTPVAFEIEGRRPSGRVIAAVALGLDDERPALRGNFGAEARTGDPSANNDHVKLGHFAGGYELESRTV